MIFTISTSWCMIALLTLTLILSQLNPVEAAVPTSSIIDLGSIGNQEHELGSILTLRDASEDPVLRKASEIIRTKLSGSTTLQDAAVKLIKTCKTAGRRDDGAASADLMKEVAKQIYAIKATDSSLSTAGLRTPKACYAFCGRAPTSWFGVGYFSATGADDFDDPVTTHDRSLCLRELYKVANTWTSYSNHVQDANSLCEISSIEHAPRLMLELLQDIADVVPSLAEMFRQQQSQQVTFMENQQRHAREMAELHKIQLQEAEDQHEAVKDMTKVLLEETRDHVQELSNSLRIDLLAAGGDINAMQRTLKAAIDNFHTVRDTQDLIYQQYQSVFTDATALQAQGMTDIERTFSSLVYAMTEIHDGLSGLWDAHLMSLQVGVTSIAANHHSIAASQVNMMSLQSESIERQHESLKVSEQLSSTMSDVLSQVEGMSSIVELFGTFFSWFSYQAALAVVAVSGITCFLAFCGCVKHAGMFACFWVSTWALSLLFPNILPRLRSAPAVMSDLLSNAKQSVQPHQDVMACVAASVLVFVLMGGLRLAIRTRRRSGHGVEQNTDRSARAQTVAPDFYSSRSARNKPRISKDDLRCSQQKLNSRLSANRRYVV